VANGSERQNVLVKVQAMSEIPGFVFDHNVSHDIPKYCSAEEHDQDGDDELETQPPDMPIDFGTQNTQELVRRVVDSSNVVT
jgi:hypothetical protein